MGDLPTAGEWQALGAMGTFVVAAVAAVIAFHQYRGYREGQEALTRPYVIVDVTFRPFFLAAITVRNASPRAAVDLTMTVAPAFIASRPRDCEILNRVFDGATTVGLLAPDRQIHYLLDEMPQYVTGGFPLQYVVTARYRDGSTGAAAGRRTRWYTDTFVLDLDQWLQALADDDPTGDIVRHLERVWKELARIAERLPGR